MNKKAEKKLDRDLFGYFFVWIEEKCGAYEEEYDEEYSAE